jgi:hypothetical protein
LGSFWGISDREQGRLTADIDGNFDGRRKAHISTISLAGRPPAGFSHSSWVSGLSDTM